MTKQDISARDFLANAKFFEGYSRYDQVKERYENWNESVDRVMDTHKIKYAHLVGNPEFDNIIKRITNAYYEKRFLGAQRGLQFAGDQLLKHEMKLYNCVSGHANRSEFFNEFFYILLCGCGGGYSVQKHHINQLPQIKPRTKKVKPWVIEDSIEGWADALGVLMSSFFVGGGVFPKFEGNHVQFDKSKIRNKGAIISGGFLAPGPEPLMKALQNIESILIERSYEGFLRPIDVYDICCHVADAVVSGGVRRAATICLFSPDDDEMMKAKTGNWFEKNPQRGRSNNSAVFLRKDIKFEQLENIMKSIREFGEPGFIFVDSLEHTYNPCVEIGMLAIDTETGKSGWQGCNLTEINGALVRSVEQFYEICETASMLATIQAGYTNFKYVSDITRKIFEKEALLGVSITGWMNSPSILLNEEVLRKGAQIVLETNKKVAKLLGINPAARATCVKPSGNASTLLGTAPATQGEHSKRYFRNTQMNKQSPIAQRILEKNPYMVENSVWSANDTDYVVSWPHVAHPNSLFKSDLRGVNFLETVKFIQDNWVEYGTDESLCTDPTLRHNVSNTVQVDDWDAVTKYVFENRDSFTGISFISLTGDKDYAQAPFTEVKYANEIVKEYGDAALFASGLIVDSTTGFRDLWQACYIARFNGQPAGEIKDLQSDWIRRFHKFATNHFDGDLERTEYCLKDVYLLHKWNKIQQTMVYFDFNTSDKTEVDIDTMGAMSCYGGACEI